MSDNTEIKWYVVHTYSGYENKVKANLEKAVENSRNSKVENDGKQDLSELIFEVKIPTEDVTEIKNNKRRIVQRKILPGYVMIKMIMTNEAWYVVRNTRGVTGFVGAGNKPSPLSETDFASIFDTKPATSIDIQVGDTVRILGGFFENQLGKVIKMDEETQQLTVAVTMMGRETTVELAYDEVIREED